MSFYSERCPRLHLTSEILTWDPQTILYKEQERAMTDISGTIVRDAAMRGPNLVINELSSYAIDSSDIMHNCNFHQILELHVTVSSIDTNLNGHVLSGKIKPIDSLILAALDGRGRTS
jgi:hypothetical protein